MLTLQLVKQFVDPQLATLTSIGGQESLGSGAKTLDRGRFKFQLSRKRKVEVEPLMSTQIRRSIHFL
jgi:hypothetical protein